MTFSRTRQCLWTKGETSGNYLYIESMYADCDGDTLLIKGAPRGADVPSRHDELFFDTPDEEGLHPPPAERRCSNVTATCPRVRTLKALYQGVKEDLAERWSEAVESIVEAVDGNRDRFIYEASDLIYHLLVLMEQMGCSIEDMERELALRHK